MTAEQAQFVGQLAQVIPSAPPASQAQLAQLLGKYLVLAGGGSGLALNGQLPSLTMAGAIAGQYGVAPSLTLFPTSGLSLPGSFHPMQSLVGNFPV
jgi:hypothetical protein